jgi:putative ABC transport system substrate-binding protein
MPASSRRQLLRGGLALAGLGLLVGCELPRLLWQPPKVHRIGLLAPGPADARARVNAELLQGLADLGYVEGRNLALEYRFADSSDRLADLAAELVGLPVDLIVTTGGSPAAVAAQQATATIPIVFIAVGDPVGTGLVASLARPGGNLTGLSNLAAVLPGKVVEQVHTVIPALSRLAVIANDTHPVHPTAEKAAAAAAQSLGIEMQVLRIRSAGDYEGAFRAAASARADAVFLLADSVGTNARDQLAELGLRYRLPTAFEFRENAAAGGLLSYGTSLVAMFRRAATYVDKILKGAKPAELPVEQPTEFDLIINFKTAQALGLTIPQTVLQQATEVIR